uniref:Transporter n=1 Tax=Ciona savignyi TaxID=51511 RepID=H2ZAG7_CIOSA
RVTWGKPIEFIFSLLGYMVGLGNLWRFSYLCFKNGGGAFLVPYLLSVAVFGLPMYIFEIAIGQFTQQGKLNAWDRIPIMKGYGYACIVMTMMSIVPYMLVMAWGVIYLYHSFTSNDLPWTVCDNQWNTQSCISYKQWLPGNNSTILNDSSLVQNYSDTYYVLRLPNEQDSIYGGFNWPMLICLVLSYLSIVAITIKGIKSSGKVSRYGDFIDSASLVWRLCARLFLSSNIAASHARYSLTPAEYKVRAVSLAACGCIAEFVITAACAITTSCGIVKLPNFNILCILFVTNPNPQVWIEAASQVLYTYAIGFASLTTFSSYNNFNNNFYRQALILVPVGAFTSLLMGLMTFSYLGHMASVLGVNVDKILKSGPGLIFQVIPLGFSLLPLPQLWSVLFFGMFYFVAVDSVFSDFDALVTSILDIFPRFKGTGRRRVLANFAVAFVLFVASCTQLTSSGIYIFEFIFYYGASGIILLLLALCESLSVGWLWDVNQFAIDLEKMTGDKLSLWFKLCYRYFIPAITSVGDFVYPVWANLLGWILSLCSLLWIPGVFIYVLYKGRGSMKQ